MHPAHSDSNDVELTLATRHQTLMEFCNNYLKHNATMKLGKD